MDINALAYNSNPQIYLASVPNGGAGGTSPELRVKAFLEFLPPKSKVFEIGSAGGRDAKLFLEAGVEMITSDYVDSFLQILQSEGFTPFRYNAKTDDVPVQGLDGIYANAVFVHFTTGEIMFALHRIYNALNGDGVCFISLYKGTGHEVSENVKGLKREFHFHSHNEMQEIFMNCNFEVLWENKDKKWLQYVIKKNPIS